ncbi:MAG TPA: hypothetical protein P5241_03870, partial [Candidatus Paceibacterota bacterium]|nr:hypothetical protein [Candidatus Paceibacterota bacterium]
LFIGLFLIRIFELYFFLKRVSRLCYEYDWKFVSYNEEYISEILKKDYYLKSEWSAYNFMFLNGPSPLKMFFSFKLLTIENIYKKDVIERIKKYANF